MLDTTDISSQFAADIKGLSTLRTQAGRKDPEAIRAAARQFEAMVVQTMLKTMRETRFTTEDDVLGGDSTMRLYKDLLDQQWAQQISASKGLGFADAMANALMRMPDVVEPDAVDAPRQRLQKVAAS